MPVGDLAPTFVRAPVFGLEVDSAALAAAGGLALVFLRYPGSAFTRQTALALDTIVEDLEMQDRALVAVIRGSERNVYDFVPRYQLRFPVVHDPEGELYARFGVGVDTGLVRSIAGLRPASLQVLLHAGQGRPEGPIGQRPAAVVIGRDGRIRWEWRPASAFAVLDVERLAQAALEPG